MILIGPSKGRGVAHGRMGGRPGLGGCKGLISDPNADFEDIFDIYTS